MDLLILFSVYEIAPATLVQVLLSDTQLLVAMTLQKVVRPISETMVKVPKRGKKSW